MYGNKLLEDPTYQKINNLDTRNSMFPRLTYPVNINSMANKSIINYAIIAWNNLPNSIINERNKGNMTNILQIHFQNKENTLHPNNYIKPISLKTTYHNTYKMGISQIINYYI